MGNMDHGAVRPPLLPLLEPAQDHLGFLEAMVIKYMVSILYRCSTVAMNFLLRMQRHYNHKPNAKQLHRDFWRPHFVLH